MNLILLQKKIGVSYNDLNEYAVLAGYSFTAQSIGKFVKGTTKRPTEEMVDACEAAFMTACEGMSKPIVKEVEAWFEKYRGGGGDEG